MEANGVPKGAMANSGAVMINMDGAHKAAMEIITKVMEAMVEEAKVMEAMEPQLEARPPEGVLEVVGDPNVEDPKEEDVTTPIRKLPINCHFLSSKKSVHKKYQKIAANYFYYRTTIFLRYQLLELQLQNSLDISICFPSLSPKQQKRYIKKHNHFFMDPKKKKFPQDPTWVSSKKKKIFCLINLS